MNRQASFIRVDAKVLQGCRSKPDWLLKVIAGELKSDRRVDMGQAWDGVHYLLSPRRRAGAVGDTGDPFGLAMFGGESLNSWAVRRKETINCLEPAAVARLDRELQKVGGGQLHKPYDPTAMEDRGVAPGGWPDRGDEGFECLLDAFLQWRELFHRAAEEGQAVICVLK